jgi:hypothetical protein
MEQQLNLESMHERHRALTKAIAAAYSEAASVCFARHHVPPVSITLSDNGTQSQAELHWTLPDLRIKGAWANSTDATEAGAYGCVIAAVESMRNFFAVRRAETGTGADYYVGPVGAGMDDLEDCFRLEISGVDSGGREDVTSRLQAKMRQAQRGKSNLPALAGVIGFSAKLVMLGNVLEEA